MFQAKVNGVGNHIVGKTWEVNGHQDSHDGVAVKYDGTPIPIHIWNERVPNILGKCIATRVDPDPAFALIFDWLHFKMLCRWQRNVTMLFWKFIYTCDSKDRRIQSLSVKQVWRNSKVKYEWVNKYNYATELAVVNQEFVCAGRYVVTRCAHA